MKNEIEYDYMIITAIKQLIEKTKPPYVFEDQEEIDLFISDINNRVIFINELRKVTYEDQKVFVSETDITEVQNRVKVIEENGVL